MDRELANRVLDCLRLTGAADTDRLREFTERDWRRTLRWLDTSGLALYLLRRLQSLNATDVLPPTILERFRDNLAQNRQRLEHVADQFATINQSFHRAGVNFAVVKGLALVPEFCPDASLRPLSDLDYLVDQQSMPVARRVLEEAGYCLHRVSDLELKFRVPSTRIPTRADSPYSRDTEPLIELHLGFWSQNSTHIALAEPEFRLDETVDHEWQGLHFPVLRQEVAFVLQVIHVFQHLVEGWVKLCWLFEMSYFLSARFQDDSFWDLVDVRMREAPLLAEFAAIVMGLAGTVFGVTLPPRIAKWSEKLRVPARLWLDRYGRTCLIEDHPVESFSLFTSSKLFMFLQWEFMPDPLTRQEVTRRRLLPWKSPEHVAPLDNKTTVGFVKAKSLQSQFVFQRLLFHLGSDLRFLWELPRWQELKRQAKVIPPGSLREFPSRTV